MLYPRSITAECRLNHKTFNLNTNIQMLPPTLAAPPATIHVQFEISDPDGLHQAQLYTKHLDGGTLFITCQGVSGKSDTVEFEFTVTEEILKNETIGLRIIDAHGNFEYPIFFPIDITSLLPLSETISIPDPNLAAVIRKELGLASRDPITQQDMLGLLQLVVRDVPIKDLTGLEHAINLRLIRLTRTEISDISLLKKLTNLDWVDLLRNHKISDISPLEKLTNLENLHIYESPIIDISVLEKLTNLQRLSLNRTEISDISPLEKLTNLRSLHLKNHKIIDVSPLEKLTNLQRLEISGDEFSDISALESVLEKLTNLVELFYTNYQISDLSALKKLTNLRLLWFAGTEISDLSALEKLTNLETLVFFTGGKISDISPLEKLTNLQRLQLHQNQISDVSPLAALTQLRVLQLHQNQISDVSPLAELVNLEVLFLVGNPIKNRKPLFELLEKNPDVKIYLKRGGEPLPVTLSHFRAEHTNAGVALKWTTESELDNAGFYIHRSETKDGTFKVVNPTMIQGAGTTSERNEYTWKDTTAKPNVAYYYRIEDISHAGVRKQLATVHMRGFVSATGKLTTRWADLKTQN